MTKMVLDLHAPITLNLYEDPLFCGVILSLFCDARGRETDGHLARGWWGDDLSEVPHDRWGSLLWQLIRSKNTPETLRLAEDYAAAALKWITDDKVAERVNVIALARPNETLGLVIKIDTRTYELDIRNAD